VPASTSRIRFTITADHTDEHIDQALTALAQAGRTLNMI
jgi:7-keto-8-aminopelargonate synthetase-like enzyme